MCTNLLRKNTGDYTGVISARTMDFGTIVEPVSITLKPSMVAYPRDIKFPTHSLLEEKIEEFLKLLPKRPLEWENKYGFVAVDVGPYICDKLEVTIENFAPIFLDGMNEKGLSAATLWLTDPQYEEESETEDINVMFLDVVCYALGTCADVHEVRSALESIRVTCPAKFLLEFPAHYIFIDSNPDNDALVVEYLDGKANYYDVKNGVLTNSPDYPAMLKELDKYSELSIYDQPDGTRGLTGLPADSSPVSRFVRATKFGESSYVPTNTVDAVSLVQTIIQNEEVIIGTVVEKDTGKFRDYTQWTVIRDHIDKVFYYKTVDNQTLKKIDLKEIDFASIKRTSVPMGEGQWSINKTRKYFGFLSKFNWIFKLLGKLPLPPFLKTIVNLFNKR